MSIFREKEKIVNLDFSSENCNKCDKLDYN